MSSSTTCSQSGCTNPPAPRPGGGFYRSCVQCKERRAAWQRKHEAKRAANGSCRSCGEPCDLKPDGTRHDRCATRRDRRNRRTTRLLDASLCACGRPRDERADGKLYSRCPDCRQRRKARKVELVARGGCRVCFYQTSIEGHTVCERCLPVAQERDARRRLREAEKRDRLKAREAERVERQAAREAERRERIARLAEQAAQRAGAAEAKALREAARKAHRLPDELRCTEKRCERPRGVKTDGTLYAICDPCRERHNRNQRRRSAELRSDGGCSKCAYRPRVEGDYLCAPCRETRDAAYAEAKELRRISREIDEWAAKPERAYEPTPEDCGISRWNSRKPREATAAYWSPNPDPHRELDPDANTYSRFRRC